MWWIFNTKTNEKIVGFDNESDAEYALEYQFCGEYSITYVLRED